MQTRLFMQHHLSAARGSFALVGFGMIAIMACDGAPAAPATSPEPPPSEDVAEVEPAATDVDASAPSAARTTFPPCADDSACKAGSLCYKRGGAEGVCAKACAATPECGAGMTCTAGVCLPHCGEADECPFNLSCGGRTCTVLDCYRVRGACGPGEVCAVSLGSGFCKAKPLPPTCGTTTGLPPTTALGHLTYPERYKLCDWQACQLGGYGSSAPCDGGITMKAPKSATECLLRSERWAASCYVPLQRVEACTRAVAADRCNVELLETNADCSAMAQCF